MQVKEERKIKTTYLQGHFWATENIKRIQEKIDLKDSELCSAKSVEYSDMPKGGNGKTMEDKIIDKVSLERRIKECDLKRQEIAKVIGKLENQQYALILELRYIDYLEFVEIAERMEFSYSTILKTHRNALDQLVLPA